MLARHAVAFQYALDRGSELVVFELYGHIVRVTRVAQLHVGFLRGRELRLKRFGVLCRNVSRNEEHVRALP